MIRIFGGVVTLLGFGALAVCQTPELIDGNGIVFLRGAVVIDGTGAPPKPTSTVVLENGRILRVGPDRQFRAGDRARVVNLEGKWLLPGFIDVHVHAGVAADEPSILTTLVAFGVTTMRSVATADANLALRDRIAQGEVLGPRLLTTGPLIDAPDSVFTGGIVSKVGSTDEIRTEVRRQASMRVDFIKLLTGLTPDLVRAAIDEAHRASLRVIGHLGRTTWLQGAEAGIDELTHSAYAGMTVSLLPDSSHERFKEFFAPNRNFNPELAREWRSAVNLKGPEVQRLAAALAERKVVLSPTLVLFEAQAWGDDPGALQRLEPQFATQSQRSAWEGRRQQHSAAWSAQTMAACKQNFPVYLEALRIFYQRGVPLAAGTDLGNPWMTAGVSFHRELQLLAAAGIPPLQVLRIATRNGAETLGIAHETGTVEAGKRADLIVLAADPLKDIGNTRRIEHVFMGGHEFTPAVLLERRAK